MRIQIRKGMGFGLTSGIITTLGLMVGLYSGTHSQMVVLGGILFIAIADSLSDSLGIHISEESDNKKTTKDVWESTFSTLFFKIVFTLTFVVPVLLLSLQTAVIISIIWGFSLLTIFSLYLAKKQNKKPIKVVREHLIIATIVIVLTHFLGKLISNIF